MEIKPRPTSFSMTLRQQTVTWFPDTSANQYITPNIASKTNMEPYLVND
jgi:hypothetical protein